jgi:purine-cytosine permease-like protein
VLCYAAIQVDLGRGGAQKNAGDFTAAIMKQPVGRWLILLVGLILLAVGLVTIYQAYQSKFEQRFKWNELSANTKRLAVLVGRIGYSAKGIVLGIVGLLFAQAALQFDPQKASGLGEALARLPSQPYGMAVLLLVALGLIAYGLYALFLSQFRRINVV